MQTTLFPALIPSRLEIRCWYGDIRPRPLNPAGSSLHRPSDDANCNEGRQNCCMDSRLPCKGCTRPRPRGDFGTQMETPPHSKPLKAKTFSLVTLLLCLPLVERNVSPHHPVNMTWLVYNPETRHLLNSSSNVASKGTWWPVLTFDLCVLAADTYGSSHG